MTAEIIPETAPFWEAAARGELLLKKCLACGESHYYPRALCPFCFSEKTEWSKSNAIGTLYSYSVMRRAPTPYAIGYVALDEGVTILTRIVDCDFNELKIGLRVVLRAPGHEEKLPSAFTPAPKLEFQRGSE